MIFFTYKEMYDEYLYTKNSSTSKILGVMKVILNETFKKLLPRNNVIYILSFHI